MPTLEDQRIFAMIAFRLELIDNDELERAFALLDLQPDRAMHTILLEKGLLTEEEGRRVAEEWEDLAFLCGSCNTKAHRASKAVATICNDCRLAALGLPPETSEPDPVDASETATDGNLLDDTPVAGSGSFDDTPVVGGGVLDDTPVVGEAASLDDTPVVGTLPTPKRPEKKERKNARMTSGGGDTSGVFTPDRMFDRNDVLGSSKDTPALVETGDILELRYNGSPQTYEVLGELGRGAMGAVNLLRLVRDEEPQEENRQSGRIQLRKRPEQAAFKYSFGQHPYQDESLESEFFLLHLNSEVRPHVGNVVDAGKTMVRDHVISYLTMEQLYPEPLTFLRHHGLIRRGEGVDPRIAMDVYLNLLYGLYKLHAEGYIHGDIKPDNIMLRIPRVRKGHEVRDYLNAIVSRRYLPVFVDWGCVWKLKSGLPKVITGTPRYIAPEHFLECIVSRRKDCYSLSLYLYELLTGFKPYAGRRVQNLVEAAKLIENADIQAVLPDVVVDRPNPHLSHGRPTMPEDRELLRKLSSIIEAGARRSFEDRYSPGQLLDLCRRHLDIQQDEAYLAGDQVERLYFEDLEAIRPANHPYLDQWKEMSGETEEDEFFFQ